MPEETLPIDETIKKNEIIFRTVGLNIKSGVRKSSDILRLRLTYIFNFFWMNTDVLGGIAWIIDGGLKGKDFLGLTFMAPCTSFSTLANTKALLLLWNENNVHKLMDEIRELERKQKQNTQSKEKTDIINKEINFLNLIVRVFNIVYSVLMVTFALSPLILMAIKYFTSNEVELMLPFLILYPFDALNIKYWPFVYLHQIWSECVVALNVWSSDNFFFTCCIHLRIQYKLLQHDIERIVPEWSISKGLYQEDAIFTAKFKKLIKWHQHIIESMNLLEIIYCKATLLNFMLSSFMICLTGFNVTNIKDIAVIVSFMSFLSMSLFQVFFLCFFADLVTTSSTEVSNAVYNTQWYMSDTGIRKKLLIVLTRSQEPCKLTAFGFADVNLNSFMRVLSTSWSYFALLQTIYGN